MGLGPKSSESDEGGQPRPKETQLETLVKEIEIQRHGAKTVNGAAPGAIR